MGSIDDSALQIPTSLLRLIMPFLHGLNVARVNTVFCVSSCSNIYDVDVFPRVVRLTWLQLFG
jgi:hypothetical protein